MLSPETLEAYRQMTPSERLVLTLAMMKESEPYLLLGSSAQVSRKFQRINEQNDERNSAMLSQLARSQRLDHD
ncbi:hypothetical protein LF1_23420 [Rubripirellula obstinata]|uniref:Uncharacterized protein n=1 Tax=Rubripirellula obstinata TaxID=406547 RepID=A0A5B1CIR6_9BACT|nr:hypothetical protein [Rubripirellula obstinata]KAA1259805.1 hypothetical protein LF1_23420 [Rubripirellula obstinata]